MKHRLKGLLALVLSLVMVLGMVTVGSASQPSGGGLAPTEYHVSVGGTKVTSANAANVLGDGKVSYDPDTNALTLNNFTFEDNTRRSAISSNQDLTINLIGDNSVTASNTNISGATAIIVDGNLTIDGTGSLTASGISEGIHADNVTIESGEVTAEGGWDGIYAKSVTITGGEVKAEGDVHGIYSNNAITISGGTVNATGGGDDGRGISAYDVSIENATVTAAGSATDDGSGNVTYGGKYGIYSHTGNSSGGEVVIKNSTVTAKAGADGTGIRVEGSMGKTTIQNSTVDVGCKIGIHSNYVSILADSSVTIKSTDKAISCSGLYFADGTDSALSDSTWYQWSTNNPGETTPISSATKAFALNNYGGTGQNPVPTSLTIEKISTGGTGTTNPTPPSVYYPIAPTTPEPEGEKVTSSDTFDGGIASAVVVTILSATGGAWLAKKKD